MKRLKAWSAFLLVLIFQWIPGIVLAGGEGLDIPEALDKKVPLEGLSGISLFFARTYNENLWLYAIYCTILMAVLGMVIAFSVDFILSALGMEVDKIEHKE